MPSDRGNESTGGSDRKRRRAKYLPHFFESPAQPHFPLESNGLAASSTAPMHSEDLTKAIVTMDAVKRMGDFIRPEEQIQDQANEGGDGIATTEDCTVDIEAAEHPDDDEDDEEREDGTRKKQIKSTHSTETDRVPVTTISRVESSRGGGIDELLAAEMNELRDPKKARFAGFETGCHGVVFVHMPKNNTGVVEDKGPMDFVEAIVRSTAMSKKSRTRYSMRLLPVEDTCYASAAEVGRAAKPIVARHFPTGQGCSSFKFAVVCEARANTTVEKKELIDAVAKLVPKPHTVDLKTPDKTILVQIVKTTCALGVVRDFKELAKYNLRQLTSQPDRVPEQDDLTLEIL